MTTSWPKWVLLIVALALAAGFVMLVYPTFATAPTDGSVPAPAAAFGQKLLTGGLTITPLELIEDSRCPIDVECIQAGTVRIRAHIESLNGDFIFKLDEPQTLGTDVITLVAVTPAAKYSGVTLKPADYRFTFTVVKAATAGSGVSGTVSLGPTCPLERIPPDPQCADKPFATKLALTTADGSKVVKEFSSNADGVFSIAVAPGEYAIRSAEAANILPYCASNGTITVKVRQYTTATVSCDTGIR